MRQKSTETYFSCSLCPGGRKQSNKFYYSNTAHVKRRTKCFSQWLNSKQIHPLLKKPRGYFGTNAGADKGYLSILGTDFLSPLNSCFNSFFAFTLPFTFMEFLWLCLLAQQEMWMCHPHELAASMTADTTVGRNTTTFHNSVTLGSHKNI